MLRQSRKVGNPLNVKKTSVKRELSIMTSEIAGTHRM